MELINQPSSEITQMPQAIIFDWDNTLVETWSVIRDALNTTLTTFGLSPWSMAETRKQVRKSMRDSFPDLFGENWERAGEVFYKRYKEIHVEKLQVIDGVPDLLKGLAEKNIYLSVVSNKRGDILRAEAWHLGWNRYFGAIIGANDAPKDKPAKEPIDLALSSSTIKAGPGVWFVGDSDIDLECAKNADCTAVLIGADKNKNDSIRIKADLEFSHCMALFNFIDKL